MFYWQPPGQDGWTEEGTKHLCSGTEVTVWLHSFAQQHSRSSTSLITPTNPTACGVKGLKISYFVVPQLLRNILTKGCISPEEQTVSLKSDKTDRSLHDSTGEPVSESEQLWIELITPRQSCQSYWRLYKSFSNTSACLGPIHISGSSHPTPKLGHKNGTQETGHVLSQHTE